MSGLGKRVGGNGDIEPRAGGTCMYICKQICGAHGERRCQCPKNHPDYVNLYNNSKGSYVYTAFNQNFSTDCY